MRHILHIIHASVLSAVFLVASLSSCKKEDIKQPETGMVTDKEGNVYKTVKIGNQWWMAENLKTVHYNDGTLIAQIEGRAAMWSKDTAGAYCSGAYGVLYNWYAIHTAQHEVAPEGWHIPSDEDWKELEVFLGMSASDAERCNWRGTNQGDKLKATGTDNWIYFAEDPTVWATNETGFTALPGNCRLFNGGAGFPIGAGYTGFWWSSTEKGNGESYYRHLDYKKSGVFRYYGPKNYGFSVRCVKN